MKKIKLIAVLLTAVLLVVPFSASAFALDSLLDTIVELLGGDTPGESYVISDLFKNPNGVLDEIRQRLGTELDNSALIEAITKLLGENGEQSFSLDSLLNNDFLNRLRGLLNLEQVSNAPTDPPTSSPTVASTPTVTQSPATTFYVITTVTPATLPTTTLPTTTAPTTAPPVTTDPAALTSAPGFTYAEPATVTVPELTSVPAFTPSVTDEGVSPQKNSTAKTVVGVLVLLLSLGAVVGVAVVLRRTAI